jgi:hypothetical protein
MIPITANRMSVTTAEMSREARNPMRFEKKRNMRHALPGDEPRITWLVA